MLINTLLTQILPMVGGFYLLSRIYSSIFNVNPKHELTLKQLSTTIQEMSGAWWFLIPFIGASVLLYNLCLTGVWFVGELIGWGVRAVQWIYQEVIVAGLFLIAKVIWHYAIKWPWRILIEGFAWIKPSMNLQNFKVGFLSLFAALSVVFIGRYLEMGLHWPNWITLLIELISVVPLGIGAGLLILSNGKLNHDPKIIRNKYLKHLGYLLGLFGLLVCIEILVVYIFSFGGFASTLSTLWIGGNLALSVLLIFNALLLIFTISVLPSFSMENDTELKTFLSSYWDYIKVKGLHHFLAVVGTIIPAVILCIIPYYLISGSMYVSGQMTNEVKALRMGNNNDSAFNFNLSKLRDQQATSDSQLTVELKKHTDYVQFVNSNSDLIRNFDYLNSFYSRRGSEYAAAPIGIALYEYTYYMTHAKNYLNSERILAAIPNDTNQYKQEIKMLDSENESLKDIANPVASSSTSVDSSVTAASNGSGDNVESVSAISDSTSITNAAPIDNTLGSDDASKVAKAQVERNKKLIAHMNDLRKNLLSSSSTVAFSDKLAFLFYSLWLAAAIAASLAFGFVVFVLYQRSIYLEVNSNDKLYITELISESNGKNKNQPFMALIILLGLYYGYRHNNYNPLEWKLPVLNNSIQSKISPQSMDTTDSMMSIDTLSSPVDPSMYSDPTGNPVDVVVDSTVAVPDVYGGE